MITLWPPADYPTMAPVEPAVTGCTLADWTAGLSELTAENPAAAAVTTRTVRPLFVNGQGGVLRWSVQAVPLGGAELDVQAQVIFTDDDGAQVSRWTGQQYHITAGATLSARLDVPRLATGAQLKVLSLCDTNSGQWTESDVRLEQVPADDPWTPQPVDAEFGLLSPDGVAPPAPSAGLPSFEAESPARRSPQVRWCQTHDSIRPDLTPKRNAREV